MSREPLVTQVNSPFAEETLEYGGAWVGALVGLLVGGGCALVGALVGFAVVGALVRVDTLGKKSKNGLVGGLVGASIGGCAVVGGLVGASVGGLVGASVGGLVGASEGQKTSYLFVHFSGEFLFMPLRHLCFGLTSDPR